MEKTAQETVELIHNWMENKKGFDITTIDVAEKVSYAEKIVICSGQGELHTRAIADYLIDNAQNEGIFVQGKEGLKVGNWILIDFSDVIVHIFTEETREYYNIENLWK